MASNFTNGTFVQATQQPGCQLLDMYVSHASRTGRVVALSLLGFLSLVANLLVLGVLYKNREMRTATNIFIANMAVSDLLYPIVAIPKEIVNEYMSGEWLIHGDFGNVLCKFLHILQDISTTVSIESHVAISLERFYAVMFPLRARRSGNNCLRLFVLAFTWISAISYYAPYFITFRLVQPDDTTIYVCQMFWEPYFTDEEKSMMTFYLTSFSLMYAGPLIVITVLYFILFFKLRKKKVIGNDFATRAARETQQNKHITKLAITIVGIFAVSWLPLHVLYMVYIFKWEWKIPCGMQIFWFSAFYIGWLNSFFNPTIYFIFSQNYRNGLRNLLRGLFICGSRFGPLGNNSVGIEPTLTALSTELRETSKSTPRKRRRKTPSPELSMFRQSTPDSHPEMTSAHCSQPEVSSNDSQEEQTSSRKSSGSKSSTHEAPKQATIERSGMKLPELKKLPRIPRDLPTGMTSLIMTKEELTLHKTSRRPSQCHTE